MTAPPIAGVRKVGDMAVRVFAPASVTNLGPGFDVLGLALNAPGDTVTARQATNGSSDVTIVAIRGDGGALPMDPRHNTAGVAAVATLRRAGITCGIELEIDKGLSLGSGLGSSAASAAAAAYAVNLLMDSPLEPTDLIPPCVEAEGVVSGTHADNVTPALLGGLALVRSVDPLDIVRLPVPDGLLVVCATPAFELSTRYARQVLPESVSLQQMVAATANLGALVSACHSGDLDLLARSIADDVVAPARAQLIPGAEAVIEAAQAAGALGSSISGAGPTIFALCSPAADTNHVGAAMSQAFERAGLDSELNISPSSCPGARQI